MRIVGSGCHIHAVMHVYGTWREGVVCTWVVPVSAAQMVLQQHQWVVWPIGAGGRRGGVELGKGGEERVWLAGEASGGFHYWIFYPCVGLVSELYSCFFP